MESILLGPSTFAQKFIRGRLRVRLQWLYAAIVTASFQQTACMQKNVLHYRAPGYFSPQKNNTKSIQDCQLRKAIFSSFYNILQLNFAILLNL
jgi:hypothetical protein